jgi:hypothetical protein
MIKTGGFRVTVDVAGKARPGGFIVTIEPEAGAEVGTYGGSGEFDAKSQVAFENVRPGNYVLQDQPKPLTGDQKTNPKAIDWKGGQGPELTLRAK